MNQTIVLLGSAGIGKSEIALQYASSQRRFYHGVFWLSAEPSIDRGSSESLSRSLQDLKEQLDNITINDWTRQKKRLWLLVIDGLDDLRGLNERALARVIPRHGIGDVIITSQRRRATELGSLTVNVEALTLEEASTFLTRKIDTNLIVPHDQYSTQRVARMLDCTPMALAQCIAVVNLSQKSLSTYAASYHELMKRLNQKDGAASLLDDDEPVFGAPSKTILTAWELSFHQIASKNQAIAGFLCSLAWLDTREIDHRVLERAFIKRRSFGQDGKRTSLHAETLSPDIAALCGNEEPNSALEKALAILFDFSLLVPLEGAKRVSMSSVS